LEVGAILLGAGTLFLVTALPRLAHPRKAPPGSATPTVPASTDASGSTR
jgi:hypothetical protein